MDFETGGTDCNLCNSSSLKDDENLFCQCTWRKDTWVKGQKWLGISLPP